MAQITLIEAVTQALAYEMAHDESVVVLGEDVGVNGGVFRATQGLQEKFGELRVLDTPLDETTIAGVTVGLAVQGMKPVAEAQFEGFDGGDRGALGLGGQHGAGLDAAAVDMDDAGAALAGVAEIGRAHV